MALTSATNTFKKDFTFTHRFTLTDLLLCLQDVAIDHAEVMGVGYSNMIKTQMFWVLSRQKIIMSAWPASFNLTVVTWSRPLKGISATRDFEIYCDEEKIGECSTRWMVLDAINRRPAKPVIDFEKVVTRQDSHLSFDAEKVDILMNGTELRKHQVMVSDLDINNHVNNTKYTEWILEAYQTQNEMSRPLVYEINFLSETHLDDLVSIQYKKEGPEAKIIFQGVNELNSQVLFTAAMTS